MMKNIIIGALAVGCISVGVLATINTNELKENITSVETNFDRMNSHEQVAQKAKIEAEKAASLALHQKRLLEQILEDCNNK